ncbi:MAG TPA: carcinine hydrolase/isopenicillin-N N-acyltransferase family protein [Myxococcaceae bacterium]|nr:carcinine hydrolase/isopenicillin-N N-acyltransferase family protein [Myxococcaceae bacterium]
MCDTIVATPPATADGAVWFGKNSDREPGEAQVVEHLPEARHASPRVRCTHVEVPQVERTHEVVLSRPFWMWGCEMGANARGVAIGNEAVFTKVEVARTGLLGMDLQRLALERANSADEALELIVELLGRHGQGGVAGYRNRSFRYHNSFLIADASGAWVLETAGPFWAAERVRGVRTISNVLTVGARADRVHPGAADEARRRGWLKQGREFDFAACFGSALYRSLTGGEQRRACTRGILEARPVDRSVMFAALRDHAGQSPRGRWVMEMPCAHASWQPTRSGGQTTGSMVSRLGAEGARHWMTGTSSPCLSVFKPVPLGGAAVDTGPAPGRGSDGESLFWRHERLHRAALHAYEAVRGSIEGERQALESRDASSAWAEHRDAVKGWAASAEAISKRSGGPFGWYWARQRAADGV